MLHVNDRFIKFTLYAFCVFPHSCQKTIIWEFEKKNETRGADKSLARPTSRCILFDGENICFDASLVLYI